MEFKRVHSGYYTAKSYLTHQEYVIRTRPKNDGWMAIDESDGVVMATGLTFDGAKEVCEEADKGTSKEQNCLI